MTDGCEPLRLTDADIARTARTPLSNFAEMRTDLMMAAGPRFHEPANIVVTLPGTRFLGFVGQLVHEISQQAYVALLPKKQAVRRSTIATRAARFLVILLNRFRQREMNYGAHRGFIDPQAKSNRAKDRKSVV